MKKPAKSPYGSLLVIAGILTATAGLNYGNGAEAGDTPAPHFKWLIGLGLFVFGIWLFSKRQAGIGRTDAKELAAGIAALVILLGFSLIATGSGPSGLYQNDGYSISGGLLILYGGGLIGYMFGERRARALAKAELSEVKMLAKTKGGKS